MMNKISDVQELRLTLHGFRTDQGNDIGSDLEHVTIELKLDEIVREHVNKFQQQVARQLNNEDKPIFDKQLTLEQALANAVPSSGRKHSSYVLHVVFIMFDCSHVIRVDMLSMCLCCYSSSLLFDMPFMSYQISTYEFLSNCSSMKCSID
jgi:hypothetical protein